jgi:hypothetical protein
MRIILSIILLVSLCQGQTDRVLAFNPTAHPRQQVIVFGIPKGTAPQGAQILQSLPTVDLCTALALIPAFHNGYVKILPPSSEEPDFSFSASLTWAISDKEVLQPFKEASAIASNAQMMVRHYVGKNAHGIAGHLIVYQGAGEEFCRYEYMMAGEFLDVASKTVQAGLSVTRPGPALILADRLLGNFETFKGYEGTLRDRQGFCSFGSVISPPSTADSLIAYSTKLAEAQWEVTSCGRFDKWGPWDTSPGGTHMDRSVRKGLLDHRGAILNMRPGDTGEQFGFGVVKHLDAIRPGQLHRLAHDRAAVLQAACRPMWLFELDGSMPSIAKHPKFVSWDETWHWHVNIGLDRFGRYYTHGGWYDQWTGMDAQHYSVVALSEDVILRGGFLSQLILEMKGFHWLTEIGYPTSGRALGRYMFAARDFWVATGDKRYVDTVREKWLPGFKRTWKYMQGHWVTAADVAKLDPCVTRLIADDPHTKIPGAEWVTWEDGIAIQGLDVIWPLLNDPEVKLATFLLARSIVNHGFDENGRIYKAIRWNGARKPLGPELALSTNTNYSEWAIPGIAICIRLANEFGDKATEQKAIDLLKPLVRGGYQNLDSYLGPLGGRR